MYNALAALTAARVLGAGEDAIHAGLAGAVVCGRVEPVPLDAPFTVVIDYAHNEAAAECLLRTLRAYRPTRLVAVFGLRRRAQPPAPVRHGVGLRTAGGLLHHHRG